MATNYYSPNKGAALLEKYTHRSWRPIHPEQLQPNLCVAMLMPANPIVARNYPLSTQYGYIPRGQSRTSHPDTFYKNLKTVSQHSLKVIPAIKYDLKGIELSKLRTIRQYPIGSLILEGSTLLSGTLVVKPKNGINLTTISINNNFTLIARQAKNDFISSLKLCHYENKNTPSVTLGTSLSDKVLMTTTNVSISQEAPNVSIVSASFSPHYYEIESRFGLNLEIQLGYEFTGKATFYPNSPTFNNKLTQDLKEGAIVLGTSLAIGGVIILAAFAVPEIAAGTVIGGLSLIRF